MKRAEKSGRIHLWSPLLPAAQNQGCHRELVGESAIFVSPLASTVSRRFRTFRRLGDRSQYVSGKDPVLDNEADLRCLSGRLRNPLFLAFGARASSLARIGQASPVYSSTGRARLHEDLPLYFPDYPQYCCRAVVAAHLRVPIVENLSDINELTPILPAVADSTQGISTHSLLRCLCLKRKGLACEFSAPYQSALERPRSSGLSVSRNPREPIEAERFSATKNTW